MESAGKPPTTDDDGTPHPLRHQKEFLMADIGLSAPFAKISECEEFS